MLDEAMGWSEQNAAIRQPADPSEPYFVFEPPCPRASTVALTCAREKTDLPWAYAFRDWRPVSADLVPLAMSGARERG